MTKERSIAESSKADELDVAGQVAAFRETAREVYARYNGRNAFELAHLFGISMSRVNAIVQRNTPDFSDAEARKVIGL